MNKLRFIANILLILALLCTSIFIMAFEWRPWKWFEPDTIEYGEPKDTSFTPHAVRDKFNLVSRGVSCDGDMVCFTIEATGLSDQDKSHLQWALVNIIGVVPFKEGLDFFPEGNL